MSLLSNHAGFNDLSCQGWTLPLLSQSWPHKLTLTILTPQNHFEDQNTPAKNSFKPFHWRVLGDCYFWNLHMSSQCHVLSTNQLDARHHETTSNISNRHSLSSLVNHNRTWHLCVRRRFGLTLLLLLLLLLLVLLLLLALLLVVVLFAYVWFCLFVFGSVCFWFMGVVSVCFGAAHCPSLFVFSFVNFLWVSLQTRTLSISVADCVPKKTFSETKPPQTVPFAGYKYWWLQGWLWCRAKCRTPESYESPMFFLRITRDLMFSIVKNLGFPKRGLCIKPLFRAGGTFQGGTRVEVIVL